LKGGIGRGTVKIGTAQGNDPLPSKYL
jgi:hypothetical protein